MASRTEQQIPSKAHPLVERLELPESSDDTNRSNAESDSTYLLTLTERTPLGKLMTVPEDSAESKMTTCSTQTDVRDDHSLESPFPTFHLLSVDPECLEEFPVDVRYDTVVVQNARKLIAEIEGLISADSKKESSRKRSSGHSTRQVIKEAEEQLRDFQTARSSGSSSSRTPRSSRSSQRSTEVLETRISSGICLIFANSPEELSEKDINEEDEEEIADILSQESYNTRRSSNRVKNLATSISEFFNIFLDFKVIVHWNKESEDMMKCLRDAAIDVMDKDCIFVFLLGQGDLNSFQANNSEPVALSEVFSTLAIGQRGSVPMFVLGEVSDASLRTGSPPPVKKLNLTENQVLVWLHNYPTLDLLFDQIRKTWTAKDVGSTVGTFVEWMRKGEHKHSFRYLTSLRKLVYLIREGPIS